MDTPKACYGYVSTSSPPLVDGISESEILQYGVRGLAKE